MNPKILVVLGIAAVAVLVWWLINKPAPVRDFPKSWHKPLKKNVEFYRDLKRTEKKRFRQRMMEFLSRIRIEGVETEVTDLDKILVAASAVIPVFGFPKFTYSNLNSVLLYPKGFRPDLTDTQKGDDRTILGLVGSGIGNQMILSRPSLRYGFRNPDDKKNTGIHEFVHLVDAKKDLTDAAPAAVRDRHFSTPWLEKIHQEMEAINADKSDIRKYAGTKKEEFLAVAAEYFFERPHLMEKKHPQLYKMLVACFQQDPSDEAAPALHTPAA